MSVTLFGIPNCDTVKKARKWLDANGVDYAFHDYKKSGVPDERLRCWIDAVGWETVLNKRGTTFRKLSDAEKTGIDATKAAHLLAMHPSMIKRPIVEHDNCLLIGFVPGEWETALG